MNFAKIAVGCAAGLVLAGGAQAQVAVSADIGTTGVGAYLVVPMETTINGRFGLHTLSRSKNQHAGDIDYDTKATLRTADILFDWFALEGSPFRLTAGVIYNGNKLEAKAQPASGGSYTINGKTYTAADVGTLDGLIEFRRAAPYFGVGWGNPLAVSRKKWHLVGDLGVFVQGPPKVKLVSLGCTTSQTVCRALAEDVAAERTRFEEDIDFVKIYPVLRIGAAYRF
jgi:hypothetical protein